MLKYDTCITVIVKAVLEIFYLKWILKERVREVKFLLMPAFKVENNRIHDVISDPLKVNL